MGMSRKKEVELAEAEFRPLSDVEKVCFALGIALIGVGIAFFGIASYDIGGNKLIAAILDLIMGGILFAGGMGLVRTILLRVLPVE